MNDAADVFKTLRADELAVLKLRTLYEQYGYKKFSMGKFEEYDFYAENRDFLPNNRILTFNDADGKLMALRPDVTMSIVKKTKAGKNGCEKLYYTENVYRAAKGASEYRETFQVGIEHIGAVTPYTNIELATLAVRSLSILGRENVLDISHMGFLNGVLNEASPDMQLQKAIRRCLEEKNAHELSAVTEGKVSPESAARFTELLKLPEDFGLAVERADALCVNDEMKQAVAELKALYGAMRAGGVAGAARLDFSIGSDEAYYNGLMFRGYVRGVPRAVLSGGRYDPLLSRMGKPQMQAIGFAIYFNELERFLNVTADSAVETVVLYGDSSDTVLLAQTVARRVALGERVWTGLRAPEGLSWKNMLIVEENRVREAQTDA